MFIADLREVVWVGFTTQHLIRIDQVKMSTGLAQSGG